MTDAREDKGIVVCAIGFDADGVKALSGLPLGDAQVWLVNCADDSALPAAWIRMDADAHRGAGAMLKAACAKALDTDAGMFIPLIGMTPDAEELPAVLAKWREVHSDVVVAGRQRTPGLIGRVLRRFTGREEIDFLSGCRGCSREVLQRIRYYLNSDTIRCDTELLLQAIQISANIVTVPVACDPPRRGIGDYLAILRAGLGFRLHEWGMMCSLKYRRVDSTQYVDKTGVPYSSHAMALKIVERLHPKRILDLGCGPGYVARQCEQLGAQVTGTDLVDPETGMMTEFCRFDLSNPEFPFDPKQFDLIMMMDIIEHLTEPEEFLLRLKGALTEAEPQPLLVLSTPNVAFLLVRLNLLFGRFPYAERGILDITHKRLFTRSSLRRALHMCGYEIQSMQAVPVPFATVMGSWVGRCLGGLARLAAFLLPSLFAFQYLVVCRPLPPIRLAVAAEGNS